MDQDKVHPNWVALATVPFQRKVFIKASEAFEKAKKDENVRKRQLEGFEAKEFYQSVLSEPSTSTKPKQRPKIQIKVGKKANLQTKVKFRESDLLKAVEYDDIEFVSQVISSQPEMKDFKDNFGWSLLMIASKAGSEKVLHYLKGQNADLNVTDKTGQDCISLAKNKTIKAILTGQKDTKVKIKTSKKAKLANLNCDLCDVDGLDEDQYKAHLASTVHQYKEGSNKDLKVHYVIPEANRGFQMMLQSGWESNKGLGPQKDGKLYPVKTALKRDKHGLGLDKTEKKVTHFQSFDDTSVKNPKKEDERVERAQTMKKRLRDKHKCKQTMKEVDFRREFM